MKLTVPSSTHSSRPPPTPYPTVGTASPSATFLVRRGNDLWLIRLDRNLDEQVTTGSLAKAGYAGSVHTDTGTDLYFTVYDNPDVVLLRRALAGGPLERVFTFRFYDQYARSAVAIAPDGRHLAYVDSRGLHVRSVTGSFDRLISENSDEWCRPTPTPSAPSSPEPTANAAPRSPCTQATHVVPRWSGDGRFVTFARIYYEPWAAFIIDPFAPAAQPRRLDRVFPGVSIPWTSKFCGVDGDGYTGYSTAFHIIDAETGQVARLAAPQRAWSTVTFPITCVVSARGELAVTYGVPPYSIEGSVDTLAILDTTFTPTSVFRQSAGNAVAWLPDASAVVLRGVLTGGGPGREPHYLIDRQGQVWNLAIDADEVVAVLP